MCSNLFLAMAPKVAVPVPSKIKVRKSRAKGAAVRQPRHDKERFVAQDVKVEPIEEKALEVIAPDRTSFDGSDIALLDAVLATSNVDVLENGCGICCREWSVTVQRRRERGTACKTCANLCVKISPVTVTEFRAYEFH